MTNAQNNYSYPIEEDKILEIRKIAPTHRGLSKEAIDFVATEGTPIMAAAAGEVVFVKDIKAGDGVLSVKDKARVIIQHPKGEYSKYDSLKPGEILVKQGQKVDSGEMLGFCYTMNGEPYLHFEVFRYTKENPNPEKDYECLSVAFNEPAPEEAEEETDYKKRRHHRTL